MEKIHFYNSNTIYKGVTDFVNKNVLVINFASNVPTENEVTKGFEILNENNDFVQAEYPEYSTIYRIYEDDTNKVEFSNDGSVYVEPEPIPEPEPYVPTLDDIKTSKISELSYICNQSIVNGVDIDINGVMEHFSYKDEDQVNIKEIFDLAVQTNVPMYYHADGESCKLYTVDQIITLYSTATTNKMHHITYFNQLKLYVESLTAEDEVSAIEYGQELTGEYFETYNASMTQAQVVLDALVAKRAKELSE